MVLATHAAIKDAIERIAGGVGHEVLEDSSFEVEDSELDDNRMAKSLAAS